MASTSSKMSPIRKSTFDSQSLLAEETEGRRLAHYVKDQIVFAQGDLADAVFYIRSGKVKLSVNSDRGKEAVLALLEPRHFFGEGSLAGQKMRMSTATALSDSFILCLAKPLMVRLLREESAFSEMFLSFLLSRHVRIEEDLVDQLFNSSERRLARALLLLATSERKVNPS